MQPLYPIWRWIQGFMTMQISLFWCITGFCLSLSLIPWFYSQNINHFDLFGDMSTPPSVRTSTNLDELCATDTAWWNCAEKLHISSVIFGHFIKTVADLPECLTVTFRRLSCWWHLCALSPPRCPHHLPTRWTQAGAAASSSSSSTILLRCTPPSAQPLCHQVAAQTEMLHFFFFPYEKQKRE